MMELILAILLALSQDAGRKPLTIHVNPSGGTATAILSPNLGQVGNLANSLQPPTLAFGKQTASTSSAILSISVNNCAPLLDIAGVQVNPAACSGSGSLTLSASSYAVVTGANASDFAIVGGTCTNNTAVSSNSFCTINIQFT